LIANIAGTDQAIDKPTSEKRRYQLLLFPR